MLKRSASQESSSALVKRTRFEDEEETSLIPVRSEPISAALALLPTSNVKDFRRSGLQDMNMLLTGHEGAIFSLAFDSTGKSLASGSFDSKIFLWEVYGDCKNYNVLSGHKNAVLEIKWIRDSPLIVSSSADKTVALWDANKGIRIRKYTDHSGVVNTCGIARDIPTIFCSGSDDCTAVLWDTRYKRAIQSFYHDYQVTSTALSHDGQALYTGGIDNVIRRFDLRKQVDEPDLRLTGHTDTITGLSISPDGNHILSNSMDCSLCSWDIRPFVVDESNRLENTYTGGHHGAEKNLLHSSWSPDQSFVSCGSSDRMVHIWDSTTTKLLYYLPGHKGSVNDVIFHPTEPIIASCSTDKQIFLGELGVI